MVYRILALDGGGIRGAFTAQILKMFQEELGKGFTESIDCFAGSSSGALIAIALSFNFQPKELVLFYTLFGGKIFPQKGRTASGPKYDHQLIYSVLSKILPGSPTLGDIKKHLIIPTCKLCNEESGFWQAKVYDNYDREASNNESLIDIALQTAAAPIYFPSYKQGIDGGLYAINPSLLAYASAIDPKKGSQPPEEIRLLSVGSGKNPSGIPHDVHWNEREWFERYGEIEYPLFSLLTDIGATAPEYPLEQIMREHYLRMNGPLSCYIELDDVNKIQELIHSAESIRKKDAPLWRKSCDWVEKHFLHEDPKIKK